MSRKMNLADALKKEYTSPTKQSTVPAKDAETNKIYNLPPSRRGKKALTVHLDPDVIKQIKLIGIDQEMSIQDLVREALNDLFVKHGKAMIA